MTRPAIQYSKLLSETRPEVIHSVEENLRLIRILETLMSRKQEPNPAKRKLAELLTVIINEFEGRNYPMEASRPIDVIRHLMESSGLTQKDLVGVFGTESIVSDVLNGKRELTKDHIKRLSARFGISPAAFF